LGSEVDLMPYGSAAPPSGTGQSDGVTVAPVGAGSAVDATG